VSGKLFQSSDYVAEVVRRVRAKIAHEQCPMCNHKNWYLFNEPGTETTGSIVAASGEKINAYTFLCAHCGFVRQHVASIVDGDVPLPDDWKDAPDAK